ncbi:hypothetical protein [Streptomyces ipomoeae]|nr:hypothetical protein [Streptomyces ipomoeae]
MAGRAHAAKPHGEWIDAVRMSILAPEWAAHGGRPEADPVSSTVR